MANWEDNAFRPFCSERCKLIDFGRWADEEYRVAGEAVNIEESESETAESSND